jgi:hypothetical protein
VRPWLLHGLFAIILLGSLAARERAGDVPLESGNLEAAVIRVARSHGLTFREAATVTDARLRALAFDASGCARPVLAVFLAVTLQEEAAVRSVRGPGDVLRYVYLDGTWETPDRLGIFIQRVKHEALAGFGLTQYVPSRSVLLVESPPGCQVADAVDWRVVWDRDYLTDSQTGAAATAN